MNKHKSFNKGLANHQLKMRCPFYIPGATYYQNVSCMRYHLCEILLDLKEEILCFSDVDELEDIQSGGDKVSHRRQFGMISACSVNALGPVVSDCRTAATGLSVCKFDKNTCSGIFVPMGSLL